ncbi:MAG: SpoIID/LytB domain-containing protein [Cyanobacteria bacterium P01_H01_bin.121]
MIQAIAALKRCDSLILLTNLCDAVATVSCKHVQDLHAIGGEDSSSMTAQLPLQDTTHTLSFLVRQFIFRCPTALRGLFIALVLLVATPAAALEMRVAVEDGRRNINIGTSTPGVVRDNNGKTLGQMPAMGGVAAKSNAGKVQLGQWKTGSIWVEPSNDGLVWIGDRWYRGRVRLTPSGGGLVAVNHVDLEEYLYSVVGSEMPTSWPLEALKAQAVAARSYALHRRAKVANRTYDVDDTTSSQVYKGVTSETTSTQQAVNQTRGQVLVHNGNIIEAVFHSSSGGHTENVEDIWSSPLPYLRGVVDYDQQAPVFAWSKTLSASQLRQRITGIGNIVSMVPVATTPHGRIRQMKVVGTSGQRTISGNDMRNALDLRSSLFVAQPQGIVGAASKSNVPSGFVISGRGFGHGLGMSQWGAYGLAARGYNYQQILGHYYRQIALSQIQVVQ